jgi:DNA uptake protein ComE-like DNA-binding protein
MPPLTWTYSQRRVLLVLLSVLCVVLIVRYALNPVYVSDPQPPVPARYYELADKIDPNTADWQTLAALPGIGERRAKDIVAYRERVRAGDASRVVFRQRGDLLYVRGIGVAMIAGIEDHLMFPATAPVTRRSATAPGL